MKVLDDKGKYEFKIIVSSPLMGEGKWLPWVIEDY